MPHTFLVGRFELCYGRCYLLRVVRTRNAGFVRGANRFNAMQAGTSRLIAERGYTRQTHSLARRREVERSCCGHHQTAATLFKLESTTNNDASTESMKSTNPRESTLTGFDAATSMIANFPKGVSSGDAGLAYSVAGDSAKR